MNSQSTFASISSMCQVLGKVFSGLLYLILRDTLWNNYYYGFLLTDKEMMIPRGYVTCIHSYLVAKS